MKRLLIVASLSTVLAGCAGMGRVDYDCELAEVQAAKCASMEDAYKMSRKHRNGAGNNQSVFQQPGAAAKGGEAAQGQQPYFNGAPSNYPNATEQGMPVFRQPKVMRVWLAPYVDANGNLRSGEYTYFATPGAWNYGSMKSPGDAAGIFEPSKPGQLGFNPNETTNAKRGQPMAAPARPPETVNKPAIPASTGAAPDQGGITQPYQRLSQ
ncbi:Type IV conjugative transfer system lipoprotein (TraV) [compost metagenome]